MASRGDVVGNPITGEKVIFLETRASVIVVGP